MPAHVLFCASSPLWGSRTPPLTVTALDTHEVVKELRAVGFTDEQAEAVTRVIRRSQDLVTKTDYQLGLASTKADLQTELTAVRTELRTGLADVQIKLAETKSEILKWMVSTIGVQTVLILGAVAALARFVPR
jgi:hypothetical protein